MSGSMLLVHKDTTMIRYKGDSKAIFDQKKYYDYCYETVSLNRHLFGDLINDVINRHLFTK